MLEASTDETVRVVTPQQWFRLSIVWSGKAPAEEVGHLRTSLRAWGEELGAIVIDAEANTGGVMPPEVRTPFGPTLLEEFNELRDRFDAHVREQEVPEFTHPSKKEVKSVILTEFRNLAEGDALYPSDIAWKHGIDPDLVEECMDELVREGELDTRNRGSGE